MDEERGDETVILEVDEEAVEGREVNSLSISSSSHAADGFGSGPVGPPEGAEGEDSLESFVPLL